MHSHYDADDTPSTSSTVSLYDDSDYQFDTSYYTSYTSDATFPSKYDEQSCVSNKQLQIQLHTKRLLTKNERNNNKLIQMCIAQITECVFNGIASKILDIIIENVKENELQQIHEIITNIKLENDIDEQENEINSTSSFCQLPTECISNICCHLSRKDITSLKQTCYDIGVVCLDHMTKYSFGICNFNKFLQYPQFYKNIKSFDEQLVNRNYYHPSTLLNTLHNQWQIDYCISKQFMSMYTFNSKQFFQNLEHGIRIRHLLHATENVPALRDISYKKHNNCNCFLFDTRNIIFLSDDMSPPILLNKIQNVINNDKYNLCFIQYFDIEKQNIQILQPIMIGKYVTVGGVLNYIQHTFIATTIEQQLWCKQFHKILTENDKLSVALFPHISEKRRQYNSDAKIFFKTRKKLKMVILAFQASSEIDSLFIESEQQYKYMEERFFRDVTKFKLKLRSCRKIKLRYLHHISHLKHILPTENINIIVNTEAEFMVEIDKYSRVGTIGYKLCKVFKDVIPLYNIQIYGGFVDSVESVLTVMDWEQVLSLYHKFSTFFFDFVSYDVRLDDETKMLFYYVNLSIDVASVYEILNKYTFTIRYKSKFMIDDEFIGHIMKEISKSKYGDNFQSILNFYENNKNDISDMITIEDKYSYKYVFGDEFIGDKNPHEVNMICLFISRHKHKKEVASRMIQDIVTKTFTNTTELIESTH